MTIALVNSQHDTNGAGGASHTKAFNASGADFLVVSVMQFDNENNISGVTYAGVAMTAQVSDQLNGANGSHERVAIYTLVAPATGSNNIVVSYSPSNQFGAEFITSAWSGVDATTPVVSVNGKFLNAGITSPFGTTVTIDAGNVAVDGIYINATTITKNAAQTLIFSGTDSGSERIGSSYKAGATSDMDWAYTGSPTRTAHANIEMKMSAGAVLGATITTPTSSPTYNNGTTSTITIGGTTTAATSVTWSNDRGGSGSATNTGTSYSTWSISGITLSLGSNVITVTAGDGSTTVIDTITVTYLTFPTTSVLDVFTGTNGADLPVYSANWTTLSSNAGYHELEIQGNAATSTTGAGADAADAWATTYGPDCEVYATITTLPTAGGSGYVQLLARLQAVGGDNTFDGYGLEYQTQSGTDRLRLFRIDNSAPTYLGSGDISQDLSAGDSIGLSIVGSTLQAWYKPAAGSWATLGSSVTDTTYGSSGKIGLYANSTVVRIDSFGGGTVTYTIAGSLTATFTDSLAGGELL